MIELITRLDVLTLITGLFVMTISLLMIIFQYNLNNSLNTFFISLTITLLTYKELYLINKYI